MIGEIGKVVELKYSLPTSGNGDGRAFLDEMCSKAVDSTFGELLATRFASVLIAITRVIQLRSPLKVLEDQRWTTLVMILKPESDAC
jgi:hypothetical protein